jgi:hypothetical protein
MGFGRRNTAEVKMKKPFSITQIKTPQDVARINQLFAELFDKIDSAGGFGVSSDKIAGYLWLRSPDGVMWYMVISNAGVPTWQNTKP